MNIAARLSEESLEQLNQAVVRAQAQSGIRIVPVVASRSAKYTHGDDMIGMYAAALALSLMLTFFVRAAALKHSTVAISPSTSALAAILAAIVLGFLGGSLLCGRIGGMRKLFVPRQEMAGNVQDNARRLLDSRRMRTPAGETCLLMYLSLYEGMACVLVDGPMNNVLSEGDLAGLRELLEGASKSPQPADAIQQAIERAGSLLAAKGPARDEQQTMPRPSITLLA